MELFTYWEGPIPPHVAACIEVAKCYGLKVYRRDDINAPDELKTPHHRADWFRAHKLASEPCCWIDADAIMLRDPRTAFVVGDEADLYGVGWNACQPSIGLLLSHGDCGTAGSWACGQDDTITTGKPLGWTSLGASLLWPIITRTQKCYVGDACNAFAAPWHSADVLAKARRVELAVSRNAVCIHLNNQTTGGYMQAAMDNKSSLISQLLALGRHKAGL